MPECNPETVADPISMLCSDSGSYLLDQSLASPAAVRSYHLSLLLDAADGNLGIDSTINWSKHVWDRFGWEEMNGDGSF
jgi:hypothetical protein